MENKAEVLKDLIATVKAYVIAEVQEDLEKDELKARFDKLVADDAKITPLIQELKSELVNLKNAAPVAPASEVTPATPTEQTPVVEPSPVL